MDNHVFFNKLKEINVISDIWKYVLDMIRKTYKVNNDDVLNLFCLFFSLMDDGDICIKLDIQALKDRWNAKLNRLEINSDLNYDPIIEKGIAAVINYTDKEPLIFQYGETPNEHKNNMFVIYNGWMFSDKFFNAKQNIKENIVQLFPDNKINNRDIQSDIEEIQRYYQRPNPHDPLKNIILEHEQAEAIVRAKHGENLIITGGPGTGKTTVICYLLLELLSMPENKDCNIYMAAPSAKAAARMKESIMKSLSEITNNIKQEKCTACERIFDIRPTTIHKLLNLSGSNTQVTKKFQEKSIFIIDESSMIDVVLFDKLLRIIKPVDMSHDQSDTARVFLLGDKDQLPSVQPGAVFNDLVQSAKSCIIKLTKTHRFSQNSDIYKLTKYIQEQNEHQSDINTEDSVIPNQNKWEPDLKIVPPHPGEYPVKFITVQDNKEISPTIINWYNHFYTNPEYEKIYSVSMNLETPESEVIQTMDLIWQCSEKSKILCAENQGLRGTENINKTICDYIKTKYNLVQEDVDELFIGEQIIITKNQYLYDLSNGDTGFVVSFNNKKYLVFKRENATQQTNDYRNKDSKEIIFRHGQYIFYPSYLLPADSVKPAYAITIHKSQGSEYENILIFLPKSLLLNRQILYTAITRGRKAIYIISDEQNIKKAISTPLYRETQLFL